MQKSTQLWHETAVCWDDAVS